MRKIVYSALLLILLSALFAWGEKPDLSKFRYHRIITVHCDNFRGYAAIEANNDLLSKSKNLQNIHMDTEYFIEHGSTSKKRDWFVKDSTLENLDALKAILDNDKGTYVVAAKPQSKVALELKNPAPQTFDKIVITVRDSELRGAEFFRQGMQLEPKVVKDMFIYTYLFEEKISADSLSVRLSFDNILKVAEIEFFDSSTQDTIYLFINDECNRSYHMYYGDFGGTFAARRRGDAGKNIPTVISPEDRNPTYTEDFDSDGIANEQDNCVLVGNPDQKDINYNSVGDGCEDFDNDRILNTNDNCPDILNYNQMDVDKDGRGDACDTADNRLSERYSWVFYVIAALIVTLFGVIGVKMLKKM